jgi:hypothetical protein
MRRGWMLRATRAGSKATPRCPQLSNLRYPDAGVSYFNSRLFVLSTQSWKPETDIWALQATYPDFLSEFRSIVEATSLDE